LNRCSHCGRRDKHAVGCLIGSVEHAADISSLPPALVEHVAAVRLALYGAPAGPALLEARESLEAVIKALVGARGRAEAAQATLAKVRKDVG
jgi:hypothetical protein